MTRSEFLNAYTEAVTSLLKVVHETAKTGPTIAKGHAEVASLLLAQQANAQAFADSLPETAPK